MCPKEKLFRDSFQHCVYQSNCLWYCFRQCVCQKLFRNRFMLYIYVCAICIMLSGAWPKFVVKKLWLFRVDCVIKICSGIVSSRDRNGCWSNSSYKNFSLNFCKKWSKKKMFRNAFYTTFVLIMFRENDLKKFYDQQLDYSIKNWNIFFSNFLRCHQYWPYKIFS